MLMIWKFTFVFAELVFSLSNILHVMQFRLLVDMSMYLSIIF